MKIEFGSTSNFRQYQFYARQTAIYPDQGKNITYPTLGLCGEAGEVAEKIKKTIRDNNGTLTEETRQALEKELGDVLWYISNLATELNLDLQEIAKKNLEKLFSRLEREQIKGDGDNR
jgi:NTP pyrophosphatase (non-canonical NTP hydrolase)